MGEATCGEECIELCAEFMPDLLILGPATEIAFMSSIRSEYPSVLIMSASGLYDPLGWHDSPLSMMIAPRDLAKICEELFD